MYLVSFILELIVIIELIVSLHRFFLITTQNSLKVTSLARLFALFPLAALGIMGKIYLKTSYEIIAKYTNIDKFRKAGLLHLIGSIIFTGLTGYVIFLVASMPEIIDF